MRVLIACEFSGRVRDAFIAQGHEAVSCDVLPSARPGPHLQGDVRKYLYNQHWDMLIAHPPCTYLCNSGSRWLYKDSQPCLERRHLMRNAIAFFKQLQEAPIEYIAIENPVMHGIAWQSIGDYSQKVQPWMFGSKESKGTCFWLKGLPNLQPSAIVPKHRRQYSSHNHPQSVGRGLSRSITPFALASAMAEQWGSVMSPRRRLVR